MVGRSQIRAMRKQPPEAWRCPMPPSPRTRRVTRDPRLRVTRVAVGLVQAPRATCATKRALRYAALPAAGTKLARMVTPRPVNHQDGRAKSDATSYRADGVGKASRVGSAEAPKQRPQTSARRARTRRRAAACACRTHATPISHAHWRWQGAGAHTAPSAPACCSAGSRGWWRPPAALPAQRRSDGSGRARTLCHARLPPHACHRTPGQGVK